MNNDDLYNYFPAITIGGPTGDYSILVPVTSCRWAEYAITGVVNGDGATGAIVVSGDSAPVALLYDGSKILTKDAYITGRPIRLAQTSSFSGGTSVWERITSSEKRVYVRIDNGGSTSTYVTIKFRVMPIAVVPGPFVEVHPDHMHQMDLAREEVALERLKQMGVPMREYTTDERGRRIYAAQDKGDPNGR